MNPIHALLLTYSAGLCFAAIVFPMPRTPAIEALNSYVTDSWPWWYKRHFKPVHCTHGKDVFAGDGLVYTNLFPLKTVVLRLVTGFWMRQYFNFTFSSNFVFCEHLFYSAIIYWKWKPTYSNFSRTSSLDSFAPVDYGFELYIFNKMCRYVVKYPEVEVKSMDEVKKRLSTWPSRDQKKLRILAQIRLSKFLLNLIYLMQQIWMVCQT